MGVLDETIEVPRKTMCLFFLVDGSGSMSGDKIGSLNQGIREVLPSQSRNRDLYCLSNYHTEQVCHKTQTCSPYMQKEHCPPSFRTPS